MPRRLTTEEFITKARKVHGDKYKYSRVNYVETLQNVIIICCTHGLFEQTPNTHLRGSGCPRCSDTRSNTKEFVNKARKVHGDRYDYSQTNYTNNTTNTTITCRQHGPFQQLPTNHLRGAGCLVCSGKQQSNTAEFITKAQKIHGDRYDYSQAEYVTTHQQVTIICRVHGPFAQKPATHLAGSGCLRCCDDAKRLTIAQFITKAQKIHGDRYDYSQSVYINSGTKVSIVCREHGSFPQFPLAHLNGCGCPHCSSNQSNTEEFIIKAQCIHGDRYDYSQVNYGRYDQVVTIGCYEHGLFDQTPSVHLGGSGCLKCCIDSKLSNTAEFVTKAQLVHGKKYDYSRVEYVGTHQKVTIVCHVHGQFHQKANNHLTGSGCPACVQAGYSQKAIRWLDQISKDQNITIRHAQHGGEFKIPGTKWKADGYCAETNTIYEFHGDVYHGNPSIYHASDRCHPFNARITAGELYQRTLTRDEQIRSLGYNLVVMWEAEFPLRGY